MDLSYFNKFSIIGHLVVFHFFKNMKPHGDKCVCREAFVHIHITLLKVISHRFQSLGQVPSWQLNCAYAGDTGMPRKKRQVQTESKWARKLNLTFEGFQAALIIC